MIIIALASFFWFVTSRFSRLPAYPTELYHYRPDPLPLELKGHHLTDVICADRTTQIDVILGREPHQNLFVFHSGDDPELHVKWNRRGEITKRDLPVM